MTTPEPEQRVALATALLRICPIPGRRRLGQVDQ